MNASSIYIMQDIKYKSQKQIVYNTLYVMHCNEFINIAINQCLHKYCYNKCHMYNNFVNNFNMMFSTNAYKNLCIILAK